MRFTFQPHRQVFVHLAAAAVLAVLTLAIFADVLFCSSETVLSKSNSDLACLFMPLRGFAIKELLSGNFPLWNPYLQSGVPYFGQFETALFYPLTFIYLLLPMAKAINASIALHTFLSGLFMYLWASHRKLHPIAALLAGVILMFCGARYAHVSAGHLSNLATMAWAPLLFLAIDGLFDRPSLGWVLLGTAASALMVCAGHPQYTYFTAIAAAIYCVLSLVRSQHRKPVLIGLAAIGVAAFGLVAVKMFTGMAVAQESVRSGGLDISHAHVCSFSPESFLTLLCPFFFGTPAGPVDYWGRWFWWEMCLFISISALFMVFYGACHGEKATRRFSITMVVVMLLFSMGGYLPLFHLTLNVIPGFDMFRGHGKFIFQASLFLIMLAGIGFDHLIRHGAPKWSGIMALLVVPCLLVVAAVALGMPAFHFQEHGIWSRVLSKLGSTGELSPTFTLYNDAAFQHKAGINATRSLAIAAGIGFALVGLLAAARRWPKAIYATALLATVELLVFARLSRPTFDSGKPMPPELSSISTIVPHDQRALFAGDGFQQVGMNVYRIWGPEVVPMKRYAEFMAFTQGLAPDLARENMTLSKAHPFWRMLRCQHVFIRQNGENKLNVFEEQPLPRLLLVNRYRVLKDRDQIFAAMAAPEFDPFKEVVLEQDPKLTMNPSATASGEVRIVSSTTNDLVIEADLPEPAILLNTASYSKGWRVLPLAGSAQKKYEVIPANYVLRGIPLSAGHHRIRLEYAPLAYRAGRWVSLISLIAYLVALGWWVNQQRKGKGVTVSGATPKPSRRRGKAHSVYVGGRPGLASGRDGNTTRAFGTATSIPGAT